MSDCLSCLRDAERGEFGRIRPALPRDRYCERHRAILERVKVALGKRNAAAPKPKPAPVTVTTVEPAPRRPRTPPNFASLIVEYVTEQDGRPVTRKQLADHFGVAERTAGRYVAEAKARGQLFQAHGGVLAFDGPVRLGELVRQRGAATAAEAAGALGASQSTVLAWAKRARARGLIRVEPGDKRGYLPVEPQATSEARAA
jgi:hypothetical protein